MKRIKRITWEEYNKLIDKILKYVKDIEIDLVIGIMRGSLPMMVSLSHKLEIRDVGILNIQKTKKDDPFSIDIKDRIVVGNHILPKTEKKKLTVLLLDDVVAFGDTIKRAESILREYYMDKDLKIIKISIAFNKERYLEKNNNVKILDHYFFETDRKVWIVFPWE